jgi:hypothetical protein
MVTIAGTHPRRPRYKAFHWSGITIVVLRRVHAPKAIEVPIEVRFSVDTCGAIEVAIDVDRGSF